MIPWVIYTLQLFMVTDLFEDVLVAVFAATV